MNKAIAVIAGDGIGPEITAQAKAVLARVGEKFGHNFCFADVACGGNAVDHFGEPLPQASLEACMESDSVLLGAVGGPKWDGLPRELRPEWGLLKLRSAMGLYANLRPAVLYPVLQDACPLKPTIAEKGIDMLMVRELIGGIYFGEHSTIEVNGEKQARDVMAYSTHEIARIAHTAFQAASKRRRHVTSIDKSNVLDCSRLWRTVVEDIAMQYPEVKLEHMLVDNAAMQLVQNPARFDVILTENMFGDILSDEASMITGSIGMIPSASLGVGSCGLYEPIHGSAPDIAGQDVANPIGTILAAAMMLEYAFGMGEESRVVKMAVEQALCAGYRTGDIMASGCMRVGCREMGKLVGQAVERKI